MAAESPLERLHHIGIAVPSIQAALPGYLSALFAEAGTGVIHDPLQQARVLFLRTQPGEHAQIELVEPDSPQAPLARFLEKRGAGLHHLCYEVSGVQQALERMRGRNAVMVSRPQPAAAFQGRLIAWVMSREGLLIELLESAA